MPQRVLRRGVIATQKVYVKDVSQGRPRNGRDSILLKLKSRKANTLSALNKAPGRFFTLNAIDVLFASAGPSLCLGESERIG